MSVFLNMSVFWNISVFLEHVGLFGTCRMHTIAVLDSRFPGADPSTNQRFDFTVTFVEALVDFPDQLFPRESRPSGNLARTSASKENSVIHPHSSLHQKVQPRFILFFCFWDTVYQFTSASIHRYLDSYWVNVEENAQLLTNDH
ncbi:TPA: hypothetical protein R1908_002273 [Staphylococcus delphini]|nr:hypothetical protein [Staphylococcus delphini]